MRLPPHNQRRLNAAIGAKEPGRDWYEIAYELQLVGKTYLQISEHFAAEYGFTISQFSVRHWMLLRRRELDRTPAEAAAET